MLVVSNELTIEDQPDGEEAIGEEAIDMEVKEDEEVNCVLESGCAIPVADEDLLEMDFRKDVESLKAIPNVDEDLLEMDLERDVES